LRFVKLKQFAPAYSAGGRINPPNLFDGLGQASLRGRAAGWFQTFPFALALAVAAGIVNAD